jgi:PAS domain S-box-containing protein
MQIDRLEGLARALFEESGDALFLFDPDTDQLLEVNPLAEKLTGFSRQELLRQPATYLFRFGGRSGKERLRRAATQTSVFHSQEGYFLRTNQDGAWVAVNLTMSRLHVKPKTLALITARDVREYHGAAAQLEQMEAELRRVLTSVSDCLWSAEIDARGAWNSRYVSPVVESITGRPPSFFMGPQQWWVVVHPDDLARFKADYVRLRQGQAIQEEYRFVRPDGTVRWVRASVQVSRPEGTPESGAKVRLDGVLADVTRRKEAEAALMHERYLLHALMDHLPEGIYFKDPAGRFLRINRAQARWFGLADPAEAVGKTDSNFFAQEHATQARADEQEVMQTGQPLIGKEEKETWPDGRQTWVLTTKLPLRDPEGHIAGTFGISRDITRRKLADEEKHQLLVREQEARKQLEAALVSLRASESRFRRLFESKMIGILFADLYGNVSEGNDAFLRMTGYDRADLPLRWDTQLTPPEHRAADLRALHEIRATGQTSVFEKEYIRKDGTRVPVLLGAAMLEGSAEQCIAFVLDMSERDRMRAMVAQTEKLASIGLLFAGIAHEINNPLAYVTNNLGVLEQGLHGILAVLDVYEGARDRLAEADPEAARKVQALAEKIDLAYSRGSVERLLARTTEGVRRISATVAALRGVARKDPGQMAEAPAADLIEMSLEVVRGRMRQSAIALETTCTPGLRVYCSAIQISQVLLNLLLNAVQAVESAGRGSAGRIRIAGLERGGEVVFEVADNGTGIDPADRPRIFDPFFTRKPIGEGTGLGLSISHGIVNGHGGRIEVDTRPGEGSTFRVVLPRSSNLMPGAERHQQNPTGDHRHAENHGRHRGDLP